MVDSPSSGAKPRLMIVGAGPFQLELLQAAKPLAETIVLDGNKAAPGLALADEPHVIDIRDREAVVRLASTARLDGVITSASDAAVPAVSAVADALGLIGLPAAIAERCRDKLLCFEAVHAAGLPVPLTLAVASLVEARQAVDALSGFPVIVKPRSGGGGRGVSLVRSMAELAGAYARARDGYSGSDGRGVLVQERIGGRSLGVEALFVAGKLAQMFALDDQFGGDYVSPIGHSLPPDIDADTQASVRATVEGFGRALGLTTSAVNLDLRIERGRPVLIEINPRLGGNSITALVSLAYGVDLARAAVLCALGRDARAELQVKHERPVASRLIMQRGRGAVRVSDEVHRIAAREDVIALDLNVRDGERTSLHVDDYCLLGRCLVRAESGPIAAVVAAQVAEAVNALIRIESKHG
jgi:biotin carboxylase